MKRRGVTQKSLAALIAAAFLTPHLEAARIHPEAGSTAAAFLKLGAGARPMGMGGAFTAAEGDPYSIYWNPAGLASLRERRAGFFHNEHFQGFGQEFLYYAAPAAGLRLPFIGRLRGGVFGLGLNYFYTPDELERRSGLYESDPVNPISPVEGYFGAYDLALSASYAWRTAAGDGLGATLKVIRQSIDDESGMTAALDLGAVRKVNLWGDEYSAGVSLRNLGPGLRLVSRSYALPLSLRAGLSRRLPGTGALAALDAELPVDNYPSVMLGAEYPVAGGLTLRSGYRYRLHGNELGAWSGFSAGAGVAFDRLTFDYAFTPFGVLGNSHRFSINLRFGDAGGKGAAVPLPAAARPAPPAGFSNFVFKVSPRPLTLSTRGIRYEIKAVSETCGLSAMAFRTLLRGEVGAELTVVEGSPSGELLAGFPEGALPLKVWSPGALPGSVQGDINFEFRVPKAAAARGSAVFMYRKGDGWVEVPSEPREAEKEYYLFSASAPLSSHYALALKPQAGALVFP